MNDFTAKFTQQEGESLLIDFVQSDESLVANFALKDDEPLSASFSLNDNQPVMSTFSLQAKQPLMAMFMAFNEAPTIINTDYVEIENKPQINDVELIGNKTLDELGIQPVGDYALSSDIPVVTPVVMPITYAELVELKNNNQLSNGTSYRIIDYVTTTNGASINSNEPSRSVNHPFDIIVRAVGESTLSEIASCALREGDTYFTGQNIGAWQIWYDINNDVDKFTWADVENGKGVIYRMIDEKGNDLPYDFKNIQFYRNKTLTKYANTVSALTSPDGYYFTFSDVTSGSVEDFSLTSLTNNNVMKASLASNNIKALNNIVIIQCDNEKQIQDNSFEFNCYNSTFIQRFYSNKFASYCYDNIINGVCYANTFGTYCWGNTFGTQMYSNVLGNYCFKNVAGDYFFGNTIDGYFQYNTIHFRFARNNVANGFTYGNVGDDFMYNTTGLWTQYPTIGAYCYYNNFGTNTGYLNIGSYNRFLTVGNNVAFIKTPNGDAANRKYGMMYTTINGGIMGSSSAVLDLTGLPTNNRFHVDIRYSTTGQVIATWISGGVQTGLYKASASATAWQTFNYNYVVNE